MSWTIYMKCRDDLRKLHHSLGFIFLSLSEESRQRIRDEFSRLDKKWEKEEKASHKESQDEWGD